MPNAYVKVAERIDRRKRRNEVAVVDRQNFLSRDDKLTLIAGTEKVTTDTFDDICRWISRYYSIETGIRSDKTLGYTEDGKIWFIDEVAKNMTEIQDDFNKNGYPESWTIKSGNQTLLYVVDGKDLWKHDGNNDHKFQKVDITDVNGDSIEPIDNIEHKDRQWLISKDYLFVSANLGFDVFSSASDSAQIVVGSGKGENLALAKIEDTLFILNTEGIFAVIGDVISALAPTFEVILVDSKKILAGRTARLVENAIIFLADDFNLWSWNGQTSKKLTHSEKLEDFVNKNKEFIDKAVAHYDDINKYYMMSVVRPGRTEPDFEVFWDAIDQKVDFIKGRNVSAYMQTDSTREKNFIELARSDVNYLVYADRERAFDGEGIEWKMRTGDLLLNKYKNFRVTSIYPEVVPEGDLNMFFRYLMDGRLSESGTKIEDILTNNDFELWTGSLPTGWVKPSGTSAQETTIKYNGNSSAKLTSEASAFGVLTQQKNVSTFAGMEAKYSVFVWCDTADKAFITINDGVSTATSSFHPGDSAWHRVEITKKMSASSTRITLSCQIKSGAVTAYFDAAYAFAVSPEKANFNYSLIGENISLGFINITNQSQFMGRVKPKINYAKGQTIALELYGKTTALDLVVLGFGIDFIDKGNTKNRQVGG